LQIIFLLSKEIILISKNKKLKSVTRHKLKKLIIDLINE